MSESTIRETPRWGDCEYIAQKALDLIEDRYVRSILFACRIDKEPTVQALARSFALDSISCIMRRIINLAYVIALCRWKQLDSSKEGEESWGNPEDVEAFNNARFSGMFRGAVINEEVTLDLQVFSLIELWIGIKNNSGSLYANRFQNIYNDLKSGERIGLTLTNARDIIKNLSFKNDGETNDKYSPEKCQEVCYQLLEAFCVFKDMKIECDIDAPLESTDDIVISYRGGASEGIVKLHPNKCYPPVQFIAIYEQLARHEGNVSGSSNKFITLYMLSEMAVFDGSIECTYHSFDDDRSVRITTGKTRPTNSGNEDKEYIREMRKFLSFNYKDIRDMALVISDALKEVPSKKKVLFDICKECYPKIVADIKDEKASSIYWDNIVTLMLVEMGKSDFLEQILDDEALYKKIIKNIELRQARKNIINSYEAEFSKIDSRLKKAEEAQKVIMKTQLRTKIILHCFGKEQGRGLQFCPYTESLSYKYASILSCIKDLKGCYNSEENMNIRQLKDTRDNLKKIFRNIFTFLQVFYRSLDEYAKIKQQPFKNGGDESEKRKRSNDLIDGFARKAEEVSIEIKGQNLSQAFEGFCKICEGYNSYAFNDLDIKKEEARRLKGLITRSYICDIKKLRFFAETDIDKPDYLLRKKEGTNELIPEKYTIFDILEDSFLLDKKTASYLGQFQDLFLFLIYNEDYNKKGLYEMKDEQGKHIELKDKDCDPIYPYIVTYYKENIDRDQLKKCTYRVPIPTSGDATNGQDSGFVVTLLTDEEYPQDTYFCIPLRYGSSESWWINPFLYPVEPIRKAYLKVFPDQKEEDKQ